MSNSGNKGVFSNNIGSSVGGFTKRNSSDAGSAGGSGSTADRRRVSDQRFLPSLLSCHTSRSFFLAPCPQGNLPQSRRQSPMQLYSALDRFQSSPNAIQHTR